MVTRWIFLTSIFLFGNLFFTGASAQDNVVVLKKPPPGIVDWYKPVNKRQVWLHTMFRLRRELLAIQDYSQTQQPRLLKKWFNSFAKDYFEIGKMVPEWQDYIDKETFTYLQTAIENKDYVKIPKIITELNSSCNNCHDDYQAITRVLYRSADFARIKVQENGHKIAYSDAMEKLSNTVNRIKISVHDDAYQKAIDNISPLQLQLQNLANGCSDCHKQADEQVDIIFKSVPDSLEKLGQSLQTKDNKGARINLGTFAVNVCARCHSAHRTISDIKELLE